MARTIQAGEIGLILVPFIARDTDSSNLDGMEESLATMLDNDVVIEETLNARVLNAGDLSRGSPEAACVLPEGVDAEDCTMHAHELTEDEKEALRERALDAAEIAVRILRGDEAILKALAPWLNKNGE